MTTRRMAIAALTNLTLATLVIVPCSARPFLGGVAGGVIRGSITNELHRFVSCAIAIPDSYVVLDVDFVPGRVISAVGREHETADSSWRFQSEIWQFAPSDTNASVVAFSDRTVLASEESSFGESIAIYQYSVSCANATAVYRAGWEWGSTLLFDHRGGALPLDVESLERACGFRPDFVKPLAWVEEYGKKRLILRTSEYGGSHFQYLSYWLEGGKLEKVVPEELCGDLLRQLLDMTADQR